MVNFRNFMGTIFKTAAFASFLALAAPDSSSAQEDTQAKESASAPKEEPDLEQIINLPEKYLRDNPYLRRKILRLNQGLFDYAFSKSNPEIDKKGIDLIKQNGKFKLRVWYKTAVKGETFSQEAVIPKEAVRKFFAYHELLVSKKHPDYKNKSSVGMGYFSGDGLYGFAEYERFLGENRSFSARIQAYGKNEYTISTRLRNNKDSVLIGLAKDEVDFDDDAPDIIRTDWFMKYIKQNDFDSTILGFTSRTEKFDDKGLKGHKTEGGFEEGTFIIPEVGKVHIGRDIGFWGVVNHDGRDIGIYIGLAKLNRGDDKTRKIANEVLTDRAASSRKDLIVLGHDAINFEIDGFYKEGRIGGEVIKYFRNGRFAVFSGADRGTDRYPSERYGIGAYAGVVVGPATFSDKLKRFPLNIKVIHRFDKGEFGIYPSFNWVRSGEFYTR